MRTATWLCSTILILIILPDAALVFFLVYCALNGIEAAQPGVYHRAGSYPDHAAEGYFHFWGCLAMSATVALAAGILLQFNRGDSAMSHRLKLGSYVGLMAVAAGFGVWYRYVEMPRIAPDIAEVGISGNWIDWLGGFTIAIFAATAGAYRRAIGPHSINIVKCPTTERAENSVHESFLCQLMVTISCILYLIEFARGALTPLGFLSTSIADVVRYVALDPTSLLCVAALILSIRLSWNFWQRRQEAFICRIVEVDRRQFVWNWLGFATLVVIGIHVLAAYCFGFWLGPWYLYGS